MSIKIVVLVFTAYVAVTTALPPCVCTREFIPICGSDGETYPNQCQFNCAKTKNPDLSMAKVGFCNNEPARDVCICTLEYKPVCGTDGKTYPNRCSLGCEQRQGKGVEIKHAGECGDVKTPIGDCICTREKRPQCGSDGVTYPNPCMLQCTAAKSGVTLAHVGVCGNAVPIEYLRSKRSQPNNCPCPRNLKPVCGVNGVTYNNPCLLECAREKMARAGRC